MSKNTNEPAFPIPRATAYYSGMSIRDYFAAKAMQALLPNVNEFPDENWRMGVALDSYAMADAMLKAREK